jgi:hypothetical protein
VSRDRWCAGRPDLHFELELDAGCHRVSWVHGRLVLHDHDLEAERVLRALGGEPCPCLLLLDACREPAAELGPGRWRGGRGPASPLDPAAVRASMAQFVRRIPSSGMPPARQQALLGSMRRTYLRSLLPEGMLEVLASASELRRERRFQRPRPAPGPPTAEARLHAAAAPACQEAMRRARRDLRPYATLTVECWKRAPADPPLLSGSLDHTGGLLALTLPVSWLNRVWSRGLALVEGHFVLEVDRPAPAPELEASVLRWERRLAGRSTPVPTPGTLRRGPGGDWRLSW